MDTPYQIFPWRKNKIKFRFNKKREIKELKSFYEIFKIRRYSCRME